MEDVRRKAEEYRHQGGRSAIAHYIAWEEANWAYKILGTSVIICATVVGTTIFATLQSSPRIEWRICAGLVSLLAAVLSALQSFLRLADVASAHKQSGLQYSGIKRRLDIFLLDHSSETASQRDRALRELSEVAESLKTLAEDSPAVKASVWTRADKMMIAQHGGG